MAKRKAAVNDIIYELDGDDSEISSDDEVKQPKINRLEANNSPNTTQSDSNTQSSCLEIIDIDSSTERFDEIHSPKVIRNGGKSSDEFIIIDEASNTDSPKPPGTEGERGKKLNSDTIFNEDIIIDSPASNSDLGVVGCENRTPLVTLRFRDSKLAMNYKKKIKAFMLNLIKLHENSTDSENENETDLELDIWPEDLVEEDLQVEPEKPANNLFFIDTDPSVDMPEDIPSYSQNSSMISNIEKEPTPPPRFRRKGPICFNCEGAHTMRECTMPRNNAKIAENRKAMTRLGRYHVEDEQKYGHLVPGRISGQLRHALGLKRHELPIHIYYMRQLGYPPGWLEEARISHSGITLFDSSGQATLGPDEEEGEVCEPGAKDKFDIKKILDFPGFNVPTSSRYKEEAHLLGLPPMSEHDSKMAMLQVLAPNAMKAYKRKKLMIFPSAPGAQPQEGQAEMDIDSGDEVAEFPSQPPLPDDAPPPPPPPPDSSPPPPPASPPPPPASPPLASPPLPTEAPKEKTPAGTTDLKENKPDSKDEKPKSDSKAEEKEDKTESDDDVQVVEVLKVVDIPVPSADLITIDVDGDVSEPETGRASPSLDDLEQKKKALLDALGTEEGEIQADDTMTDVETNDNDKKDDETVTEPADKDSTEADTQATEAPSEMEADDNVEDCSIKPEPSSVLNTPKVDMESKSAGDLVKTPVSAMGRVRDTEYGTPVINVASPYRTLPSDDKFAKDICDVINFENLPNSIGKYKQISTLLKKVKSEVDRIQES